MKKLIVLGALVAFGYFGASAQTTSAVPTSNAVVVHEMSNETPAKESKKKKKNKSKECSSEKAKSCGSDAAASGEKKACCSSKKAAAPAEVAPAK
ncbi:MAG: hypothetical protein Q8R57_10570 [Bacteroidota bacterium]|jgi:hypothetical protein|nr:hypothetical protein [Bacteroidota bacterium]